MREMTEDARNYPVNGGIGQAKQVRDDVTLRQNIDQRIAQVEANLQELKDTKERLQSSGLLDTRIDDLSRAMRY